METTMKASRLYCAIFAASLSMAVTQVIASPLHDPTFEPNVMTPFNGGIANGLQSIKLASDGGYFLDGGQTLEAHLPCSPTRFYNMPMPGNENVFIREYFRYPLIKLKENGEMDCDFNLMRAVNSGMGSVGIFPDGAGKIYVIENTGSGLYLFDRFFTPDLAGISQYSIARFSERSGSLDGAFVLPTPRVNGQWGVFVGDFVPPLGFGMSYNRITAVGIDNYQTPPFAPKLVVGGYRQQSRESDFKHIWRLNSDGSEDATFQPSKVHYNPQAAGLHKIHILPTGKILVAGGFREFNGSSFYRSFVRLNEDGTLDESFQVAMEPGSTYSGFEYGTQGGIRDFVIQPDGKIILAGYFVKSRGIRNLVRLNTDGSLDHSFTPPDFISHGSTSTVSQINSVALQDDGKIIVAAHVWNDDARGISPVMRLNADGTLDETFSIKFPSRMITWAQTAVFDRECRLVVGFDAKPDDPQPNVILPLTGETISAPNGIIRLKLEAGVGCVH